MSFGVSFVREVSIIKKRSGNQNLAERDTSSRLSRVNWPDSALNSERAFSR